ncbi:MAG: hypothetical protein CM1200mP1_13110 [Candidatus Neomarinimicrobiota bacterium]|nr:MAG: hypothetical protein CM1200mP1_13110 [Candidatus Neomarinimicrobiota bacterium]
MVENPGELLTASKEGPKHRLKSKNLVRNNRNPLNRLNSKFNQQGYMAGVFAYQGKIFRWPHYFSKFCIG